MPDIFGLYYAYGLVNFVPELIFECPIYLDYIATMVW